MYVTHYGRLGDVPRLATRVLAMLAAMVAVGLRERDAPQRHAALKRELAALYAASLAEHGVDLARNPLSLLAMDVELNAQGIGGWLDREARKEAKA